MHSPVDTTTSGLGDLKAAIAEIVAVEDAVIEPILAAALAGGHVLIDGVPGVGKTLLARTVARCLGVGFRRIQFTNDLMPTDVVGGPVWKAHEESFAFVPGPLFSDVVLADEINRTSPRTLSCLLEAMELGRVTVDGVEHALGDPFLVLATRNPEEFHGTYPIPEAALDRFLVRVEVGYPEPSQELALYRGTRPEERLAQQRPILGREGLKSLRLAVADVAVSEPVARYALACVAATRSDPDLTLGASPRAALAWLDAGRGRALLHGRDAVLPDDLKAMAVPVLAHRLARRDGGSTQPIVEAMLRRVPVEL
ncbi:MAG: MoxR family ATPase [Planctomycetota bacterium]|nr:MoxR family ATPase [Planctomycetota bacterium]